MDESIYFRLHKTFLYMQYNYCKFVTKKTMQLCMYVYDRHPINVEIIYNSLIWKIQLSIKSSQNNEKLNTKMYTRAIEYIICIYL